MDSDPKSKEHLCIDLNHYRKLVRSYIDMRRYKTALFWAEKVVTFGKHEPKDVYWKAQCMFLLGEYHRAAHTIRSRGLEKTNLYCHYLAAECLLAAKEYQQAIELLNASEADNLSTSMQILEAMEHEPSEPGEPGKSELMSSIWLLKGKVLEAMDNRSLAMDAYVQALQLSVYCTEALDALVQHEMLMAWEERELISNLPFNTQCTEPEARIIRQLYQGKLKKYYESDSSLTNAEQTPNMHLATMQTIKVLTNQVNTEYLDDLRRPSKLFTPNARNILSPANKILYDLKTTPTYSFQANMSRNSFYQQDSNKSLPNTSAYLKKTLAVPLHVNSREVANSLDMLVSRAEKLFYNGEFKKSMALLEETFQEDPYHSAGLTVQIGCLVEMKETNKLFYLAHNLVDLYPDQAISWYAVGCYYDLINKSDPARRYLSKATTLDRLFGPAWLAYGHSFAKENEHDQAMAAYFKATQLMRGCHLPLLYIGVECGLTKNHELAEKFFYQAMSIAPLDVFVLHELGVIKYEYENYESAEEILRTTLEMVTKIARENREAIAERWEPLLNNLGHCCRKNRKYIEALSFHQQALVLKPQSASTYTAIGLAQALMWRLPEAVESLHRSLAIKRDDTVTSTLLRYCIEDMMEENTVPDNVEDSPPATSVYGSDGELITDSIDEDSPVVKLKLKFDDSTMSPGSKTVNSSFDMSI